MRHKLLLKRLSVLISSVLATVLMVNPLVWAQSIGQNDLNSIVNDTVWYELNDNSACTTSVDISLSGNDSRQIAFNYFVSQGLSAAQAAGVVGNLIQESGVVPTQIQKPPGGNSQNPADAGSAGWGIAQWTPGAKVIGIAQSLGITGPIYELPTQLGLFLMEIAGL